jgi:hypothetical protein
MQQGAYKRLQSGEAYGRRVGDGYNRLPAHRACCAKPGMRGPRYRYSAIRKRRIQRRHGWPNEIKASRGTWKPFKGHQRPSKDIDVLCLHWEHDDTSPSRRRGYLIAPAPAGCACQSALYNAALLRVVRKVRPEPNETRRHNIWPRACVSSTPPPLAMSQTCAATPWTTKVSSHSRSIECTVDRVEP